MKKLMMIIALTVFGFATVNAQHGSYNYPGKDSRYKVQNNARELHKINSFQREAREKIANGILNGSINSQEARKLLMIAERIEIKENKYLRNGRLTKNESNELERDLAGLNRQIMRERKDNDRAYVDNYGSRNRSKSGHYPYN
ncbi:hypothetical protein SAMN06298216_0322 [Spirosomataceae bacterium TFI 002]|nr:hypothetical protein SAMN06298216_0322 [Spirosomataceae bacterium TFI 002]